MTLIDKITDYGWQQGFGCVLLNDKTRLHLWHPELWPNVDLPFIHNHTYHFRSKVLIGEMIAPEYRVTMNPNGASSLICGTVTEDKLFNPEKCDVIKVATIHVKAGETYEFGGLERYHTTDSKCLVMTNFEVLPIPAEKGGSFVLHPMFGKTPPMDRPSHQQLKDEVLRLLEEHNL